MVIVAISTLLGIYVLLVHKYSSDTTRQYLNERGITHQLAWILFWLAAFMFFQATHISQALHANPVAIITAGAAAAYFRSDAVRYQRLSETPELRRTYKPAIWLANTYAVASAIGFVVLAIVAGT